MLRPKFICETDDSTPNTSISLTKAKFRKIIRTYTAPRTKRSFDCDVRYMLKWAEFTYPGGTEFDQDFIINFVLQNFEGLPHEVERLMLDCGMKSFKGPLKITTIEKRLRNFGIFLELNEKINPVKTPEVRMLLRRLRQNFHSGRKKNPITKDILDQMIDTCNTRMPRDIRDKALLLFAWGSGGRRAHEICDVKIENFTLQPNGNYICLLEKTKTGRNFEVPVGGRAARAVREWISVRGTQIGPMFINISKNDQEVRHTKLQLTTLRTIIQRRIDMIGLDPSYYSPLSIRSGFITEAGRQNMPVTEVMQMTTHKTMREMMEYYRHGSINNNVCINLVG